MKRLTLGIIIGICMISLSIAALGDLAKNEGETELSKKEIQDLEAIGLTNLQYGDMTCEEGACSTLIYVQYEGGGTFTVTTITITEGSKSTQQLMTETQSKSAAALRARLDRHKKEESNKKPLPEVKAEGGNLTLKEKK